jgi:selenocysteine lyase/cysteine desulfurase
MPDAEQVAAVREALPATGAGIYLATARAGPFPAESHAAMVELAEWELRTGRVHRDRAEDVAARLDEARAAVAAILATDLDRVTITPGRDAAFSRAIRSVDWLPGDRLVVVDDESTATIEELMPPGVEISRLDDVERPLPDHTRLVITPMIRASTGERLPIEDLADRVHETSARLLVEGSLTVGAVPVDLEALRADGLVARSEAWLLGPEGLAVVTGASPAERAAAGVEDPPSDGSGATSSFHLPSLVAFARGCGWLSMYVGLPWVHARGRAMTDRLAAGLAAIDGVRLLTPPQRATTLVFTIRGWSVDAALDELGRRIFLLADGIGDAGIRVGVGCWTTESEVDRVIEGVRLLAAHTPATLPRRPELTMLGEP